MAVDDEVTDDELIADYYGRGDNAGFGRLYDRHYARLVRYLLGRFRIAHADAEDWAELAFLRVARTRVTGRGRYDPAKNRGVVVWLRRIARNLVIDGFRRGAVREAARRARHPGGHSADPGSGLPPGGRELPLVPQLSAPVRECLAGLTEKRYQVLIRDIEGYTLEEIGRELGIGYRTAGTRLHHARRCVTACLKCKGYRFVRRGRAVPAGAEIVMRFPDELLVYLNRACPEAGL